MRLQCVVTLSVVALFTLCKKANVAARVSSAEKPQNNSSLPITNPLGSWRRWPARLLKSAAASAIFSDIAHIRPGNWLSKRMGFRHDLKEEETVVHLSQLKQVNAKGFFSSSTFKTWKKQVESKYGPNSDEKMFSLLDNEFKASDTGGIEAIIAQALKHRDTRELGLRFEDLLLQNLADGVKKGTAVDTNRYVRYELYLGSKYASANLKMQRLLDETALTPLIMNYKRTTGYYEQSLTDQGLEDYFTMISGGRKIADVFANLRPVQGFDNNDFLFEKLYAEAARHRVKNKFVDFVLASVRKEKDYKDESNADYLKKLQKLPISKNLRNRLVKPMYTKVLASMREK